MLVNLRCRTTYPRKIKVVEIILIKIACNKVCGSWKLTQGYLMGTLRTTKTDPEKLDTWEINICLIYIKCI